MKKYVLTIGGVGLGRARYEYATSVAECLKILHDYGVCADVALVQSCGDPRITTGYVRSDEGDGTTWYWTPLGDTPDRRGVAIPDEGDQADSMTQAKLAIACTPLV